MIFSLFSFRALSLFKFNVHFNFHFHCLGFKSLVTAVFCGRLILMLKMMMSSVRSSDPNERQ